MAKAKADKMKEIVIAPDYIKLTVSYGHTDAVDILLMTDIPGWDATLTGKIAGFLCTLGLKHSLGDAFDTYMVEGSPATPAQKRQRLLDKWDSFKAGHKTLRPSATPKMSREEQFAIAVEAAKEKGLTEEQAVLVANAMLDAIR